MFVLVKVDSLQFLLAAQMLQTSMMAIRLLKGRKWMPDLSGQNLSRD